MSELVWRSVGRPDAEMLVSYRGVPAMGPLSYLVQMTDAGLVLRSTTIPTKAPAVPGRVFPLDCCKMLLCQASEVFKAAQVMESIEDCVQTSTKSSISDRMFWFFKRLLAAEAVP